MNITGFHQDELGDWVATLSCGHQRHVRHKPPLSHYPWVMTKEGRQGYIGVEVACRLCEEGMGSGERGTGNGERARGSKKRQSSLVCVPQSGRVK